MANKTATKTAATKVAREIGPQEQRFNTILNSRLQASLEDAGKLVNCQVQSVKLEYPDERTGFLKDIYSFNVIKMNVYRSAWFKEKKAAAIALEASGESELAKEAFNKLLNACQLNTSFIVNLREDGQPVARKTWQVKEPVRVYLGIAETTDTETGEMRDSLIASSILSVESTNLRKGTLLGADIEEEEETEEEIPETPVKEIGKVAKK